MPVRTHQLTVKTMARPRRPNEPPSYEAQPEVPMELRRRFDLIRAVIGRHKTISEAAQELGIARVNMQTLIHRAEAAMLQSLQPRSTGPAPRSPTEKQLQAQVLQLQKQNDKLTKQLQAADEMMMAAGEIIRALRGLPPEGSRSSSPRSKRSPKTKTSSDEDPERPTQHAILRSALPKLTTRSDVGERTARLLGVDVRTLRRWIKRLVDGEPLVKKRGGVMHSGPPESELRVRQLVQDLHGLVGAESLARSVHGVSRRRAAIIKNETLSEIERRRQAQCSRVVVTTPGVVRGFDQLYLPDGIALIASDASVPYRTIAKRVDAYDADHVAAVLDEDFRTHGPPLVIRKDRASCHTAEPVASVLRQHRVLLLQGPAYYPQYYGQHERQNREHREWSEWTSAITQSELDRMKNALNECWLRPTLGWRSAAECWAARPILDDDRDELLDEVTRRAERLRARNVEDDLAMRLAIEQALTQRGYLQITRGHRLLCE